MTHTALAPGNVAVVTGAASGIGRVAGRHFASLGMEVVFADLEGTDLTGAAEGYGTAIAADVASEASLASLRDEVSARFGRVDLLMNNAATRVGGACTAPEEDWRTAFEVNFWGVFRGVQAFAGLMSPGGAIVNTGSKQGITNPPGNAAYNATKAALRFYTEQLAHEHRAAGSGTSVHLLIPGWTTTGNRDHKPGAWLPEQVVERLVAGMAAGDFYILCPDNEVTAEMDAKRIMWGAGDIAENRPALSRWHPDWVARAAKACE